MEDRTTYTRGMCPALAFTNPGVRQTSDRNKGLDACHLLLPCLGTIKHDARKVCVSQQCRTLHKPSKALITE